MNNYSWQSEFERLFNKAAAQYRQGVRGAENHFSLDDVNFLNTIGSTAQELYDFAEDHVNSGDPDFGTVLLITAARRDYFIYRQEGRGAGPAVPTSSLHAKTDKADGIEWLPRIIQKARLKLEGRMEKDLMYGCGGDRRFLRENNIHPADFLRFVWSAGDDDKKVIEFVKTCRRQ